MVKNYLKQNIFTMFIIAFCIFILIKIPSQIKVSLLATSSISPRLFPYIAIIGILICCSLSLILDTVQFIRKGGMVSVASEEDANSSPVRALICILLLFGWVAVLKKVGFIISTTVVIFILSWMLGNRNKVLLVAFPVIFTLVIYFAFAKGLHVKLPEILF